MSLILPTEELLAGLEVNAAWKFWKKGTEVKQRVGAIALSGTVAVRETKAVAASADFDTLGEMSSGAPTEFTEGLSKYVVPASITPARLCDQCQDGTQKCNTCGGTGGQRTAKLLENDCADCDGAGSFPCAGCSGTRAVHDFQLVSCIDERIDLTYTYLPDLPFEIEEALYTVFESCAGRWYPEQAVSLQEQLIGSPYRGGASVSASNFHGFDYTEALAEARRSVDGKLRGREPFAVEAMAHVIPVLIADHSGTDAAHFCFENTLITVTADKVMQRPLPV